MLDVLKIKRRRGNSSRAYWSKSLFSWIGAYNISPFSNFSEFVDFCSSFSM